jgi:glycosidase
MRRFLLMGFMLLGYSRSSLPGQEIQSLNATGTFNDWNPSDPRYRMTAHSNQVWRLKQFFLAGQYKFKFTANGEWSVYYGGGAGTTLVQPGNDILLEIPRHGAYVIEADLAQRRWVLLDARLDAPQAVLNTRGVLEANLPVILDGSESVPREDNVILHYEFGQDTNDLIRALFEDASANVATRVIRFPAEGTYRFWLRVNDGSFSVPVTNTVKVGASYQVLGDWTGQSASSPATFLVRTAPGRFERHLVSTAPGTQKLTLVRNHIDTSVVGELKVSVTQTNRQFWRVRYEEATAKFTCIADDVTEFVFRLDDFPALQQQKAPVRSVSVAGSFNGWNAAATPMTEHNDRTWRVHVKLDDGLYHYKFVLNGVTWLHDPRSDADLRVADGHGGFNSGVYVGQHGKQFGDARTNHINMAAVRHRPDQPSDWNVVASNLVEVKLRTLAGDVESVSLQLPASDESIPMQKVESAFGFDYWKTTLYPSVSAGALSYAFELKEGEAIERFGAEPFQGSMQVRFPTPGWAKHVVWYQIFPERFRNGTANNDPPKTVPWRWDWYRFTPWEKPTDDRKFSNDWYRRRFGGDVQGMIQALPYLRELGVTALYLCPVFAAHSYHGYDTMDYRHIEPWFAVAADRTNTADAVAGTLDPATWTWTGSDKVFLEFMDKAHAHGMRVIVDGVFNHMSKEGFALRDVLTNGMKSVFADWFDVYDWGPPVKYKSWDGGGWMPNFRKDDERGIASASARRYIYDITRRWMDPNGDGDPSDGVDGWRLDVAEDVPAPFWVEWRKHVKSINPNAYIVGEAWGSVPKHLRGDQWDATMNYQFAMRSLRFFVDRQRKISATEFDRQLRELLATYPLQVNMVMQNLYDSHDTDRLVNMIVNPDRDYDQGNRPQEGKPYDGRKPGPEAYQVLKLMAVFQMTYLGAPMIWYGTEVGMFGADDPTNRKPMLWADWMPYDSPDDAIMPDVLAHYKRLIAIRNTFPALRTGQMETILTDDEKDVYVFARSRMGEMIVVAINNGSKQQTIELPVGLADKTRLLDVLNGQPWEFEDRPMPELGFKEVKCVRAVRTTAIASPEYVVRSGKIRLSLPAKSAAILVPRPPVAE